jgi:hypothetical protein
MAAEIPPRPKPLNHLKVYSLEDNCKHCGANQFYNGCCSFCKQKHHSIVKTHVAIDEWVNKQTSLTR